MENWSFAICSDGKTNTKYFDDIINSIKIQNIPNYEIIFCTENKELEINQNHVSVIYIEPLKQAWITKKKNDMTRIAKFENICYMHDYIALDENWYDGFEKFGYDWNVCSNKVIRLDGERFYDWCAEGIGNIPYDNKEHLQHYVSGAYWCAKTEFMKHNLLNEELVWSEAEDIEWSNRVRGQWKLKFNPISSVKHLKQQRPI